MQALRSPGAARRTRPSAAWPAGRGGGGGALQAGPGRGPPVLNGPPIAGRRGPGVGGVGSVGGSRGGGGGGGPGRGGGGWWGWPRAGSGAPPARPRCRGRPRGRPHERNAPRERNPHELGPDLRVEPDLRALKGPFGPAHGLGRPARPARAMARPQTPERPIGPGGPGRPVAKRPARAEGVRACVGGRPGPGRGTGSR